MNKKIFLILGTILTLVGCDIRISFPNPNTSVSSITSATTITTSENNNTTAIKPTDVPPISTTAIPSINPSEKGNSLNIFFINDNHGRLLDDSSQGFARIATALNTAVSNYGEHLKIANGDIFQGTYISNTFYGKPLVECLNYMDFDAFVIGNHEFDWGLDKIARYKDGDMSNGEADFDFLGANIVYKSTNQNPNWIKPYMITIKNNRKVGVVGLIGKLENSINQAMLTDYSFLDPISTAKTYIQKLRVEEKCDSVIVAIHDYDQTYVSNKIGPLTGDYRVDALLCAHTHEDITEEYTRSDSTKMPIVQNGGNNYCSKSLRLTYNTSDVVTSYSTTKYITKNSAVDNDIHNALIAAYVLLNQEAENRVLGKTTSSLSKDQLGKIACDGMVNRYSCDVGVMNTGGVRSTIPAGNITYKQVFECFPFDNIVYTLEVSGSVLSSFYREAGSYMYYNSTFKSSSISSSKTYRLAIIDYVFTSTYYTDIFKGIAYKENDILREVVAEAIEQAY